MIKLGSSDITLKVGSNDVSAAYLGNTLVYSGGTPTPIPYDEQYLTFVALESGTFKFSGNSINYSLDNGSTWTTLAANTDSPTVNAGDKILWKEELAPFANGIGRFSSTGQFDVEGNPMSLLYGDNFIGETDLTGNNNAFYKLFYNCSELINAENLSLPATTLVINCYQQMFYNCTSLRSTPVLPATILATQCYYQMFQGCTSLTTAPELPATTLGQRCYQYMFRGCTSLITAPSILPSTTLATQCYYSMFSGCTSLATAPELPATTLTDYCYYYMFNGCTNLNYIKCLATDISANNCTYYWVSGVAASGTFVKDANMAGWSTGANDIPINWTVVDNV